MKNSRFVAWVLVAAVLIPAAMAAPAPGVPLEGGAAPDGMTWWRPGMAWFILTVDATVTPGGGLGLYVSLVIDPGDNRPYISYYDANNGDLRVARHVITGGNCAPKDSWSCETVDSTGDVGKYTAIDIYPGTGLTTWKLGVSYYDVDHYALKYAQYAWSPSGFQWTVDTIQSGSFATAYGLHTSLEFDPSGVPHIAYYRSVPTGPDALMHSQKVNAGGNCGPAGDWQCEVVDSGDGVGQYTSLALDGTGQPEIAYYDAGNDQLKHASYTGAAGSGCNPLNDQWVCSVIDIGGQYAAAVRDHLGDMHIAYYVGTTGELRGADYLHAGGNCGPGDTWYCGARDKIGTSLHPMGVSLTLEEGWVQPFYAYQDASDAPDPPVLKVQDFILRMEVDPGGPCTDEARFVSADYTTTGLATIAYYEWDECLGTGRLKVAWQRWKYLLPIVRSELP